MDSQGSNLIPLYMLRSLISSLEQSCDDKVTYFNSINTYIDENRFFGNFIKKCGIYNISICLLYTDEMENNLTIAILEFLVDYLEGFPSLVDVSGAQYFISIMNNDDDDYKILGLKLVSIICNEHKRNQELCTRLGIFKKLAELIVITQRKEKILCPALKMLSTLNWGLSSVRSKYIDEITGYIDLMLKPLCYLLRVKNKPTLHSYILEALVSIVVNYNYNNQVIREGGLNGALNILDKITLIELGTFPEDLYKNLAYHCITFFALLSCNESVVRMLMGCNCGEKIYYLLNKYKDDPEFAAFSLMLIGNIALITPVYGKELFILNFPPLIKDLLETFPNNVQLLKAGCWCIENMSRGNPEHHPMLLNIGVVELLSKISKKKRSCSVIAKSALELLGHMPPPKRMKPVKRKIASS